MNLNSNDSFVLFQNPNSKDSILINGQWENYVSQKTGFIIQSFNSQQQLVLKGNRTIITNGNITIQPPKGKESEVDLSKKEYIEQVQKFISSCNQDLFKVVSSRVINHTTDHQVNLFELFKALSQQYKNAFVYILNIPNQGMWMGATPETIVAKAEKNIYTMALAGSQVKTEKEIKWKEKEQEEHQFVIEDILNKLSNNGIPSTKQDTTTIFAGNVAHLHTLINIDSKVEELKQIADILHPTSAVCGMPQEKAKNFIDKNEPHNREYYTGYLGMLDKNLYVNLRSMKVFTQKFKLYVGGGITKASNAEKEWEETELKSKTLLSVIEKM